MTVIELPYNFVPYQCQKELFRKFFDEKIRNIVLIWHRRLGKDMCALNLLIIESQMRVGSYFYIFPMLKQARRDIWEGIDNDGLRFLDRLPRKLVKHVDNAELKITLHNGSIIRLCGADRYDDLMGSNPVGIVFSEYPLMTPLAYQFLRPILMANGGWTLFEYTPRGGNHGLELYEMAKDNPNWFCQVVDIEESRKHDGEPVVTKQMVEDARASGMSDDLIQQEFYCSFTAAVQGAYFSHELDRAMKTNRIFDFPYERKYPVYTYWDLGYDDAVGIWFVQFRMEGIFLLHYYENRFQDLMHYKKYLDEWSEENELVYETHYAPHDGNQHRLALDTRSLVEQAPDINLRFKVIPRTKDKVAAIEMARTKFNQMYFHKTECKYGLDCLREYHSHYNEAMKKFSRKPVHNWASNCADAFLGIPQGEQLRKGRGVQVFNPRR